MMWRSLAIIVLLSGILGINGYAMKYRRAVNEGCNGRCFSSGDPHYQTFDCQKFEFHGQCSYTLLTTCDESLPYLEIIGDNERMQYHPKYATTKNVIIRTTDEEIKLTADKHIFINGVEHTGTTLILKNGAILNEGKTIVVEHGYGFKVTWGSPFKAEITLTDINLKGKVCGICGNANGDPDDDLVTPQGVKVIDTNTFADSWNAEEHCGPCEDCRADVCSNYPAEIVNEAKAKCEIFKDKDGLLESCFETLSPTYHHHLCISDLCEQLPSNSSLCASVDGYVLVCQSYGYFENQTISIGSCTSQTVKCQAIADVENGGYRPIDSDLTFGSTLSFGCDFGYVLVGPERITCEADGDWNENAPTCVAENTVLKAET